ncbi:hypothetical protein HYT05_04050 [Candidatus Kaiserbacteria bacterium]|nr:hypothetical protein [Candidatus Kaiserbacteria bacterium]
MSTSWTVDVAVGTTNSFSGGSYSYGATNEKEARQIAGGLRADFKKTAKEHRGIISEAGRSVASITIIGPNKRYVFFDG